MAIVMMTVKLVIVDGIKVYAYVFINFDDCNCDCENSVFMFILYIIIGDCHQLCDFDNCLISDWANGVCDENCNSTQCNNDGLGMKK